MYRLNGDGSRTNQLCDAANENLTLFGCTDIVGDSTYQYPYATNPAVVNIDTDYLLDVVPGETNPTLYHATAVKAQAINARSYAYYHILQQDKQIENSTSFQLFIPYRFENRFGNGGPIFGINEDPCTDRAQLTTAQRVVCLTVAEQQYISPGNSAEPANTEFFADIPNQTVNGGPSYLKAVSDPISSHPAVVQNGHGRGMSQRGASRWAYGNRGAQNTEDAWSVHWFTRDHILTHYYTGVHIRDVATTDPSAPSYRWAPLKINWGNNAVTPPDMAPGGSYPITVQVQNTSVYDWTCNASVSDYELGYRWVRYTREDGQTTVQTQTSTARADLCDLDKGEDTTVNLTIADVPNWGARQYSLYFDVYATTLYGPFKFSDAHWPTYNVAVRVCATSGCERQARQLDVAFVIDTTGSMWDDIDAVQASAAEIVDSIADSGDDYRVAVLDYRDFDQHPYGDPGDYPSRVVLGFSSDQSAIVSAIDSLSADGGNDWPEAVFSGLIEAIETPWRAGAQKVIILMGDAPPHDPEPNTGHTNDSVVAAANTGGTTVSMQAALRTLLASTSSGDSTPISIYPVVIGGDPDAASAFQQLSDGTNGTLFQADTATDVTDVILNAIGTVVASPTANAGGPYTAAPGTPITFDALDSFDPDGVIATYEWDFDADGVFDSISTDPTATYTYTTAFSGTVTLQVTDDDGHMAVDTAGVDVSAGGLQVSGTPAGGSVTVTAPGRFRLVFDAAHNWQAGAWYDLESEPTTNLARGDGQSLNYNVIQSPLELAYDQWYNLDNALNPTLTIQEQDAGYVVLETAWSWEAGDGTTAIVSATHTIAISGTWEVQTILTNTTASPRIFPALEYAFTNVRPDLDWQETLAGDSNSFSKALTDGPTPWPLLHVNRNDTIGSFDTDGSDNRYWTISNISLQPGETWEVSWTNQVWPGQ